MATIGNPPFEVPSADLADPAHIETAFLEFYEGDGVTDGVEDHLLSLHSRLEVLEAGQPASGSFLSNAFDIKNAGDPTYKLTFGLAELTGGNVVLNVRGTPSSDFIVTETGNQTLTNKTLSGATNTIYVADNKFRILNTDPANYLEFLVDPVTGAQYAGIRDFAGTGVTDYIVFEALAQTVTKKTFAGYKESVYTATTNAPIIDSSAYNNAVITISNTATITINDLDGTGLAHTIFVVLINSSGSQRSVSWAGSVGTPKWSGGSALTAVTANRTAIASFTKIGAEVYATYLGEYYVPA